MVVKFKEVEMPKGNGCKGCVFKNPAIRIWHCNHPSYDPNKDVPCKFNCIFVEDVDNTDTAPQIKLISALDINLVDGLLQELTEICNEQGSRIRPGSGESIRDFVKRLIYNQHRDE
jgi:hypothetical protein